MINGSIDVSVEEALESRLVGGSIFQSTDLILNQLLSLHYRVHYHVQIPLKSKGNALENLLQEVNKLEPLQDELHVALSNNIHAIIYCELDQKEAATAFMEDITVELSGFDRFAKMLALERVYYRALPDVDSKWLITNNWVIPNHTDGLTWFYLSEIVKELDLSNANPKTPFQWLLMVLAGATSDGILLSHGISILKKTKFPSAEESNHHELEQFHMVLHEHFKRISGSPKKDWNQFIIDSMEKTFQSIPVSKSAMIYYQTTDLKRCVLNFSNLVTYTQKYFELNKKYPDLIDLISSYQFVLSSCKNTLKPFFVPSMVASEFCELLLRLHHRFNIPVIEQARPLEESSEFIILSLPLPIAKIISRSWETLFEVHKNNLHRLLDYSQIYYLSNAIQTSLHSPVSLKFKFALQLASLRQIDQCVAYLKKQILSLHPDHFGSWHLLALCESCINEDLQVSFKIVNSVIQSMCELYDDGRTFSINEKWQFVHIKLTQIQLIRDMFGLEDALEVLPEVFELYQKIFADENESLGPDPNQSIEYLLQKIWLFALELYLETNDLDNVKAALEEFKNVTSKFINLNYNLAQGYVSFSHGDLQNSLLEFEKVLHYDPSSVEALLGVAKIVLPISDEHLENDLKHDTQVNGHNLIAEPVKSLESSSAVARLKFMFEQLLDKSIEGYQTAAIWWYLAKIYEIYKDSERQQEALWQCVKFEELEPVREFRFCDF